MQLGAFSISLAVKDLATSAAFYKKLGFSPAGGAEEQNWLIMRNGDIVVGLFQGMFDSNIITFNPGWAQDCSTLSEFDDVRDIQRSLDAQDVTLQTRVDESTTGPASVILVDPDGNTILIDQHVTSP